jgi:hypothetical protein
MLFIVVCLSETILCVWHACPSAPTLNQCPYVSNIMTLFWYILSTCWYVPVWSIIPSLYQYVQVHTSTYQYIPVHTKTLSLYKPPLFQMTLSASTHTSPLPSSSRIPRQAAQSRAQALPMSFRWPMTWPIALAKPPPTQSRLHSNPSGSTPLN